MHSDLTHEKERIEAHLETLRHHPQGRPEVQQLREMLEWQRADVARMLERIENATGSR